MMHLTRGIGVKRSAREIIDNTAKTGERVCLLREREVSRGEGILKAYRVDSGKISHERHGSVTDITKNR